MQQTDDTQNITHEHLLRYVFRQLSPEEESRIEDFLDSNPHEADIVEGILQFCENHGIRTRGAFDEVWNAQKGKALEQLRQKAKPSSATLSPAVSSGFNKWMWVAAASFALLIVSGAWSWIEYNKMKEIVAEMERRDAQRDVEIADLKQAMSDQFANLAESRAQWEAENRVNSAYFQLVTTERNTWLNQFIENETDNIKNAGGSDMLMDWQQEMLTSKKNYKRVTQLLQNKADAAPESMQSFEYYVLGAYYLLRDRMPEKAVHYLEKAQRADRNLYPQFLLAAYLENRQYDKAKQWVATRNIPPSKWPKGAERYLLK